MTTLYSSTTLVPVAPAAPGAAGALYEVPTQYMSDSPRKLARRQRALKRSLSKVRLTKSDAARLLLELSETPVINVQ